MTKLSGQAFYNYTDTDTVKRFVFRTSKFKLELDITRKEISYRPDGFRYQNVLQHWDSLVVICANSQETFKEK